MSTESKNIVFPYELTDKNGLYEPQVSDWVGTLVAKYPNLRSTILNVESLLVPTSFSQASSALANLLIDLNVDGPVVLAGSVFWAIHGEELNPTDIQDSEVEQLAEAMIKMSQVDRVSDTSARFLDKQSQDHRKNVRLMLVTMIDDPRLAVLKLAERLITLHSAWTSSQSEKRKIANEVLEFYCPLASRLGVWQLKWMLEDLSFACLFPDEFSQVVNDLNKHCEQRDKQVLAVCEDLIWRLDLAGINAEVTGRAKNIYGVWRKMKEKGLSFDAVYDVEAVRVIVDTVPECYSVLGVVHTSWPPIPEEFDDYIANPKQNGYRSIHTAVVGPRGRNLEVQVRTQQMHTAAELGVCAHWSYKDNAEGLDLGKVDWMREVLNWRDDMREESLAIDFSKRLDVPERVYISTPKGHVIDLPSGSTAVDFAYRIHTEVGHHCASVRVNGKDHSMNVPLETGQIVEVVTSPQAHPKRKWLDRELGYVRTSRARKLIQAHFRELHREKNIEAGQQLLQQELQRLNIDIDSQTLASNFKDTDEMYYELAVGDIDIREVLPTYLLANGAESLPEGPSKMQHIQEINIVAKDRPRLLLDLTSALALMSVNVLEATIKAPERDDLCSAHIVFQVNGWEQTRDVINRIRAVPSIVEVKRENSRSTFLDE